MSRVMKCMCEECHYNEDYECQADGIEVETVGDLEVDSSEGTCCRTFRSRSE